MVETGREETVLDETQMAMGFPERQRMTPWRQQWYRVLAKINGILKTEAANACKMEIQKNEP